MYDGRFFPFDDAIRQHLGVRSVKVVASPRQQVHGVKVVHTVLWDCYILNEGISPAGDNTISLLLPSPHQFCVS